MARINLKILLLTILLLYPFSMANAGTLERNSFLAQVASLAEKPKQYIIFNTDEGKIDLMIRGIVLREWSVDNINFTGESIQFKPFPLMGKNVQLAQLRRHVNVDDESEDNASDKSALDNSTDNKNAADTKGKKGFELIALEVDSMPADYQLFFDDSITIDVKSKVEGYKAAFKDNINKIKAYLAAAVSIIRPSHEEKKSTKIEIIFKDKTEAQALFWAFSEGTECLFLPRGSKGNDDFKMVNVFSDVTDDKGKSSPKKSAKTK
jgi:hypothetical protein